MAKKLYIFGNGLGRALNNEFYSLERALNESWGDRGPLSDEQRVLINSCLSQDVLEEELKAPTCEDELRDLQRVVNACDLISKYQRNSGDGNDWLTDAGNAFPTAVRCYFHHTASCFHSNNMQLPPKFAESLREFVRTERPHIATLNYDDLLYEAFTDTDIFLGHMLRDGFFREFDFARHERLYARQTEGWFLHLHGSPLFVTTDGEDRKILRSELSDYQGTQQSHLVLTDAKSKPSAIRASNVLSAYWRKLEQILDDTEEVTLFGYGGADLHLNRVVGEADGVLKIRIVSRQSEEEARRQEEWLKRFPSRTEKEVEFLYPYSLLNFDDW